MASSAHRQATADLVALSQSARTKFPAVKEAAERALMKLRASSATAALRVSELLTPYLLVLMNPASPADMSLTSLTCIQRLVALDAIVPGDEIGILHAIQTQVWSMPSVMPNGDTLCLWSAAVLRQVPGEVESFANSANVAREIGLSYHCRVYPNNSRFTVVTYTRVG